jgi:hypothetical protein
VSSPPRVACSHPLTRALRVWGLQWVFAPVVWSQKFSKWEHLKYHGYWRLTGTGMISFYMSNTASFGGVLPMAAKTSWGEEDTVRCVFLRRRCH